jgi:hypothetical protein
MCILSHATVVSAFPCLIDEVLCPQPICMLTPKASLHQWREVLTSWSNINSNHCRCSSVTCTSCCYDPLCRLCLSLSICAGHVQISLISLRGSQYPAPQHIRIPICEHPLTSLAAWFNFAAQRICISFPPSLSLTSWRWNE